MTSVGTRETPTGNDTAELSSSETAAKPHISASGLDLLKMFEGLRLDSYADAAGVQTIGYGHTGGVSAGEHIGPQRAAQLLQKDVGWAERAVRHSVKVPLTQGQFDALVSFTYNVGEGAFKGSTLLDKLNVGDYGGAQAEFGRWTHAGGQQLAGLAKRRQEEAELFGGQAPDGAMLVSAKAGPSQDDDAPPPAFDGEYAVRPRDTLWNLADDLGFSLPALIAANPQLADPNLIFIGQQIQLPEKDAAWRNHLTKEQRLLNQAFALT